MTEWGIKMKKALAVLLAVTLTAAIAGCGRKDESSGNADTTTAEAEQQSMEALKDPAAADDGKKLEPLEPGKLFVFPMEEGGAQVLRSVRLSGNRAGTEAFNSKDPAVDGVRCVFELNEWVEICPEAGMESGLKCWVFRHKDDHAFYRDNPVSEDTEGFAQVCVLNKDPDDATLPWGSFYLNPEDCETGLYDLVFTDNGKAVGVLLTRFYQEGELESKSDAELEALMKGILS